MIKYSSFYDYFLNSNFFQLVAMLICIIVVICFFIWNYAHGKDIDDKEQRIQKLHTFYISGILVLIIIELVTGICMGGNDGTRILNYVNFAATLSSLIMSVVAIIFTIVTSSRGEEQYKKIDNASDKVTDSLSTFTKKTAEFDESIDEFNEVAKGLSMKLDLLLKEMGGTHAEVNQVKQLLVEKQMFQNKGEDGQKGEDVLKEILPRFVSIGSFSGNLALYACVKAKDKEKTFAISQVADADNISYMFAYLVASVSFGLIDGQVSPDNCEIVNYYPDLKDLLPVALKTFIEKQTDESSKKRLQSLIEQVDTLFS